MAKPNSEAVLEALSLATLAVGFSGPAAALCAEARLTDRLPRGPFDRRCGWIITERQVLRTDAEQ